MKIRKHKRKEYIFTPHRNSKLRENRRLFLFKKKSKLMSFLNGNLYDALNGTVSLQVSSFDGSGCEREWFVWYNDYKNKQGAKPRIELRQLWFRGRRYIFKPSKISKASKKYFAFSDKVISLMCRIQDENGNITKKDATKLIELFKKRGFVDFEPDNDQMEYINGHISNGIDFYHWSDRCNFLRCKVILEYFKRKELI